MVFIFLKFSRNLVLQFHESSIFSTLPSHHFLVLAILTSVKGTPCEDTSNNSQYIFVIAETTSLHFMLPALGQRDQLTCWFLFLKRPCGLAQSPEAFPSFVPCLLQGPLPVGGWQGSSTSTAQFIWPLPKTSDLSPHPGWIPAFFPSCLSRPKNSQWAWSSEHLSYVSVHISRGEALLIFVLKCQLDSAKC